MIQGKIPPQALDVERALIGACLIEPQALNDALLFVKQGMFYDNKHNLIYAACIGVKSQHTPVDILTVTEFLRKQGKLDEVGGAFGVIDLTNEVASGANAAAYAKIIQQLYIKRRMIELGVQMAQAGYDDSVDAFEMTTDFLARFSGIAQPYIGQNTVDAVDVLDAKVNRVLKKIQNPENAENGIKTGLHELDHILGGMYGSDLIIVAARPGMGKTAALLSIVRNLVRQGRKVGVFSLEMSASQLVDRLIAMDSGISVSILRNEASINIHNLEKIEKVKQYWQSAVGMGKLYIDDSAGLDIEEIKMRSYRWKNEYGVEFIGVDYIQLAKSNAARVSKSTRDREISEISGGLKQIAKTCNVPVIALSQLNREVERTADKRPTLSALRDGGSIEQDADVVIFPHRAGYYLNESILIDCNGYSLPSEIHAELIVAKNRQGAVGNAFCEYIAEQTLFKNANEEKPYVEDNTTYKPIARQYNEPVKNNEDDLPF